MAKIRKKLRVQAKYGRGEYDKFVVRPQQRGAMELFSEQGFRIDGNVELVSRPASQVFVVEGT
ncbi:hypothetical protein GCM10028819_15040 [Spirosoma humi]